MKTSEKILKLIEAHGYELRAERPGPNRTYAGHWQRSEGAWSWWVELAGGITIGSQWSMAEVLSWDEPVFDDHSYHRYSHTQISITPS